MEINSQGLIESSSIENIVRIILKRRKNETITDRLMKARHDGTVKSGQIAVLGDKEYLRVDARKFKGAVWIEVAD